MKEISSEKHPLIKQIKRLIKSKKAREEEGLMVVEGVKLVRELENPSLLFTCHPQFESPGEVYLLPPDLFEKISSVKTPEGLLALNPLPQETPLENKHALLALDGLSDPTNLGAIFRSALALGWEGVYLLPGCTDPFSPKAIRASMGATCKLPYQKITFEQLKQFKGFTLLSAGLNGTAPSALPSNEKRILIFGSESHGLSPEVESETHQVTIPINASMESLNVSAAAAILLYEYRRKA